MSFKDKKHRNTLKKLALPGKGSNTDSVMFQKNSNINTNRYIIKAIQVFYKQLFSDKHNKL